MAIVYVVWGSTYLAIDIAITAIPPMLLMSARFLLAGTALYAWASRRGDRIADRPTPRQWLHATLTGSILLVGGTGLVALSMTWLSSGTAALLAATVPVWMALMGRAVFKDRLSVRATWGLALGLVGVAVLVDPAGGQAPAMLLAIGGAIAWAAGSMRSRIVAAPARPMVAASMEMIGASLVFLLVGLIRGEHLMVDAAALGAEVAFAFAYLVTAGSIVAFAAYRWLLLNAPPALVGTHAYVNPVVAVLLGWAVLGEQLTTRMFIAGAIVVVSTALVVTGRPSVPVPAQPTSGADAFAGVQRLRRIRTAGRRARQLPAAAMRMGAAPVARGYRALRQARRGPQAHHSMRDRVVRHPEETT